MEAIEAYTQKLSAAQALCFATCAAFLGQVPSRFDRALTVVALSVYAQPAYISAMPALDSFHLFKEIYAATLAITTCLAAFAVDGAPINLLAFWVDLFVVVSGRLVICSVFEVRRV